MLKPRKLNNFGYSFGHGLSGVIFTLKNIYKETRLKKYKELIKQEGITAEELTAIIGAAPSSIRKKREPRPAKYKYTDETGQERTWTGQGRTPRVIQKALDKGVSLASFEI